MIRACYGRDSIIHIYKKHQGYKDKSGFCKKENIIKRNVNIVEKKKTKEEEEEDLRIHHCCGLSVCKL